MSSCMMVSSSDQRTHNVFIVNSCTHPKHNTPPIPYVVVPSAMRDVENECVKQKATGTTTIANSPAEAATNVDVVITMLPSTPFVTDVYENSVFSVAEPNTVMLDCSTIDPNSSKILNEVAKSKGFRMLDAPVSGGVGGAKAGTLTFMVGGSNEDFAAAQDILKAMGKNIVHCGGPGTGLIAKICNNMILGISMTAVSEAMNLGIKLGGDAKTLAAIVNSSSGRCWSSDTYNPVPGVMENVPSSNGYAGGFGSALMAKDLGLALDAGKSVGAPLATASATFAMYQTMMAHGLGKKDFSISYAWLAGALGKGDVAN